MLRSPVVRKKERSQVYGDRGKALAAGKDDKPFPASWLRKGAHRSRMRAGKGRLGEHRWVQQTIHGRLCTWVSAPNSVQKRS